MTTRPCTARCGACLRVSSRQMQRSWRQRRERGANPAGYRLQPSSPRRRIADEEAAWGYRRAKYWRMLSSLRRALALPEVLMCAQQWTEIDLSSVPSLAMARYKRAYLNEGKGCCKDDPERAACRDNFVKMLQEKGVSALKGKQLFPHQLTASA